MLHPFRGNDQHLQLSLGTRIHGELTLDVRICCIVRNAELVRIAFLGNIHKDWEHIDGYRASLSHERLVPPAPGKQCGYACCDGKHNENCYRLLAPGAHEWP